VKPRFVLPAAVLGLLIALFAFKASAKMPDFEVYWRAGERAAAGAPLYVAEDGHYQHKYLPAFAMLAIPSAWLPLTAAKAVWFTVSAVLVAVLLGLSLALLPSLEKPRAVLTIATLVVLAKFYGHELVLGQVNLALAVMVLLAID
jgi:alpha-1,2-mannosyltransferase